MDTTTLKEADMNQMIIKLMDKKKKKNIYEKNILEHENFVHMKKFKKSTNEEKSLNKNEIKSHMINFFQEQEKLYKEEELNTKNYIIEETKKKEKQLNTYYIYCQEFKNEYNNYFNNFIKESEEIKKELKDLQIQYMDDKILLGNKRKMELDKMLYIYKEKLLDIKNHWDTKNFCDDNLKNIVYDILNVIN
ncbi:conserved Plasmodium protein, unknown function [Plasmodium sp. gorilla clade G2]|uniref:conserved Plasmodium protein, unknown function n=1 Tax=Plasmodium sp. gorilla clade G2 TaxID=880535 RepID=UPI000D227AEA|nr:conserved Plasmodium protein, unknown function [Plasmodium sp. gorilla clade G2]SOV15043.1 conserved Plasmodium protein, unknown function [Plasmodium sp. gorilla clade G2]